MPIITYATGASESECGGIVYKILSAVSSTNEGTTLGTDLSIDLATQSLVLSSTKFGFYDAVVQVSLADHPAIFSNSESFLI